jgi:hypothetical protein
MMDYHLTFMGLWDDVEVFKAMRKDTGFLCYRYQKMSFILILGKTTASSDKCRGLNSSSIIIYHNLNFNTIMLCILRCKTL